MVRRSARKKLWIAYSKFVVMKYYNTVAWNCGDKHNDGMKLRCTHLQVKKNKEEKNLLKWWILVFRWKKGKFGHFFAIRHFSVPSKFYYGLLLNELLLQLIITNLKCNFIIVKLSEKHTCSWTRSDATKPRCSAFANDTLREMCSTAWKSLIDLSESAWQKRSEEYASLYSYICFMLGRDIKEHFRSIYICITHSDSETHTHMNATFIEAKVTFVAHLPFNNPLNGCNFAI